MIKCYKAISHKTEGTYPEDPGKLDRKEGSQRNREEVGWRDPRETGRIACGYNSAKIKPQAGRRCLARI